MYGMVRLQHVLLPIPDQETNKLFENMDYLMLKQIASMFAFVILASFPENNIRHCIMLASFVAMLAWMGVPVDDNYFTRTARDSFQYILDGIGSYCTT
jgi:hypothetical protein